MIPQPTGICYGKPATSKVRSLGGHGAPPNGDGAMTRDWMTRDWWRLYVIAPMTYLPAACTLAAGVMGTSAPVVLGVFVLGEITRRAVLA